MKRERESRNPTREALERYIAENPGSSFNRISSVFKMNSGTLRYHLEYLQGANRIRMVKKGNKRCYFPDYLATYLSCGTNGRELTSIEKRVASVISKSPGISRKEILSSIDIRRQELTQVIRKLKEENVIWEHDSHRGPIYEPVTRERLIGEVIAVLIEKLLDKEIDMETFRAIKDRLES
jgi:predicted transcriptional regulator